MIRFLALSILILTTGCSTVLEGRSQKITVATMPEGAACVLKSNDDVIGVVHSTPDTISVEKSKYDIVIECSKDGYIKSKIKNHSSMAMSSIGNMAFMQLSFVGNAIDNATGASNKYDNRVFVELQKDNAPQQVAYVPMQLQQPYQVVVQTPVAQPIREVVTQSPEGVQTIATQALTTDELVAQAEPLPQAEPTPSQEVALNYPMLPEITPLPGAH